MENDESRTGHEKEGESQRKRGQFVVSAQGQKENDTGLEGHDEGKAGMVEREE